MENASAPRCWPAPMTMALAACGQSETGTTGESAAGSSGESSEAAGEPVTVRFFNGNVEMVDWYNDAVERFNAESESVKVEHEFQKEGTSALQTKFAAGDIPDITTMGTQQMIDAGKFVDLTDSEWWIESTRRSRRSPWTIKAERTIICRPTL